MHVTKRFPFTAIGAALLLVAIPAASQQQPAPALQNAPPTAPAAPAPAPMVEGRIQTAAEPWLYKGSDITPDPGWRFGTLPNGVRYAVRRNGVPPGQVAVRVRIDAGSLMEQDSERGYAHLLEHLAFRGSEHVPDGESKRLWQRLGVTFGSDSNASTTPTQTVYKLDLPSATPQGLDESMKVLAGMMANPTIDAAAITAERPVVLAEQRERLSPQSRLGDKSRELFFAGQLLADRSPIGTTQTLQAANAVAVNAFHKRWYRPERTVIVIAGDVDPATFEQQIAKHFGSWQGAGPAPKNPDFGKPAGEQGLSAAAVEPSLPPVVSLAILRPWSITQDTILFNQERMVDQIAIRIINRRLESRARSGGSFITAGANLEDISRSANATLVQILPVGDDWEAAVRDVRATIADAAMTPPTQAEIDREVAEIDAIMKNAVDTSRVEAGATQADEIVQAVDIGETVASSEGSLAIFRGAVEKKFFTPVRVQASSKKIFADGLRRALVNTRAPDATVQARLAAVLDEDVSKLASARSTGPAITFDQLPRLGRPGKVATRAPVLNDPDIEKVTFANGVNLLLFPNDAETNKIYVRVRFGGGLRALPADRVTPAWAADLALVSSGIGKFGQEEIDRLTSGRQIGLSFAIDDDAFMYGAVTSPADLADQLKLIATKMAAPGWDPNPVARARAVMLAGYAGLESSPDGVLSRDLENLLHAKDPRWGVPPREAVEQLTPKAFRAFWEPLLATGPIEVQVYGDVTADAAVTAVANSFGALKARKPAALAGPTPQFPAHDAKPVVRYHEGQPNQAAAVIAWPTAGGSEAITENRRLEILVAIFRDRLFDQLRSQAGASYTPNVVNDWPVGLPGGGRLFAIGQIPPEQADFFFKLAREIAADLVATPIAEDELRRAAVPLAQQMIRMSSGNTFWLQQTGGGSFDPRRIDSIRSLPQDLGKVTPADIQALAAKYLVPTRDWTMLVLPSEKVVAAGKAAAPAAGAGGR
ncbi:M16 family metallopeptidase [Sphingomonas qomolangmaensis]|uniref:Insulinase family protein n=1 Tax=Sphingomonas qomolangmaensis TaxID=2918765 RepID=A0ABY5LAD1_9SPHN|nr:M16 family metallopeptidase [Sphingomonas qomolangmaensis]UUL82694.1 insulinase family protein [Sphingomonas qomolangmaensis]